MKSEFTYFEHLSHCAKEILSLRYPRREEAEEKRKKWVEKEKENKKDKNKEKEI